MVDIGDKRCIRRAGVIPYTIYKKNLFFLLGIDRETRDFTDFGGGVKSTESIYEGALRELNEESCNIFSQIITAENIQQSPGVISQDNTLAIFFVYVDPRWIENAADTFKTNQEKLMGVKKHDELVNIKWVDQEEFKSMAFSRRDSRMWIRPRDHLLKNTNWERLHLALKFFLPQFDKQECSSALKDSLVSC